MSEPSTEEIRMDASALYREEVFTDQRVGSIQRLTPVDGDGNQDTNRDVRYVGQAQIMTPAGALPISFEIDATSLGEAAQKFGDYAQEAVQEAVEQLKEYRREQASSIVVPGQGGAGGAGGGGYGGGMGGAGGGGFQLR